MIKSFVYLASFLSAFKVRTGELCQKSGSYLFTSIENIKSVLNIGAVLVSLILFTSFTQAADIGDIISNTATADYSFNNIDKNATSNEVSLRVEGTVATIALLTPSPTGDQLLLGASSYLGSDGLYHPLPDPVLPDGTTLSTTTPTQMTDATAYNLNDLTLIEVRDADRNTDSSVRDVIEVTVSSPSGDSETIRLLETDVNSGIFTGYIPLISNASTTGDGSLHVEGGETIEVGYIDQGDVTKVDSAIIVNSTDLKLWVEKQVNKDVASVGEVLKYTLVVHNDEAYALNNVVVDDYLPLGLKYKEGTSKIGATPTTPRLSADGKHLYFDIASLGANATVSLTFIAVIGAGVHEGEVNNQATVGIVGNTYRSEVANARTIIKEELMRSHGIIIGQVYECAYKANRKGHGVAGVTLYMDNGTYVVTDKNGKYHIEGVEAGTHVVQVDEEMLPSGYVMGTHAKNARFAGRNFSQFVDVGQGALKRVDFCLNRGVKVKEDKHATKAKSDVAEVYDYVIPTAVRKMPKYNSTHIRHLQGKTEILWPPEGYIPEIPSTRIAIIHDKGQKAEVWLNDQKVNMLNYDGRTTDANSTMVIDKYKGVDLLGQTNTIRVKILDKSGRLVQTLTRTLHVSSTPAKVEYVQKNSYVIADGKHSPVLAVRFLDENGYPLRTGITGTFSIEAPYASQEALDQMKENPLAIAAASQNRYTIHSEGIAYIKLQPTTKAGQVTLHFNIQNRDEVVTAWLKPKLRDWIMVGFAEGTVGYNTLSGHKESLDVKGTKDKIVKEGRVSFFAKGRILGKWLLTMAYDSGKDTKNARFFDEIDPNTYYTLYNDASIQNYEAASRKKLFLKIERDEFSILFGDFTTDLTYTKLSEYSRTMTGIKSEYHSDNVEAKAFIADTDQLFMRDEIRGDGTSGYYHLKNQNILLNSEHISIEVRDRYQPQRIIESRQLQRFRDYEIDYDRGTLYFRDPVYSMDEQFNPRYIIAEYEMEGDGAKHYTYGGRAALKTFKGAVEVGASFISEDTGRTQSKLMGADTTVKIGNNTVMKAEYARTKTTQDGNTTTADAKLVEIEHVSQGLYARAYYREQDAAFGLGQLNQNLGGTRQLGFDLNKVFENRLTLIGKGYRNTDLLSGKDQDVLETRAQIDQTLWSAFLGYRYANNTDTAAVHQMLVGASYAFFDQKLKLHATHDQSFGKDEDLLFPTKTTVGADYALNSQVNLFANYEWARGDSEDHDFARVGMRYQPWTGMTMENTTLSEFVNDSSRVYNTLGMLQTYQLNGNWSFNIGYEKGDIVKQEGEVIENNTTQENVDFSAYRLGVNYHTVTWTAMLNGEYRDAGDEQKYNVTGAVYTQSNESLALALSAGYSKFEDLVMMEEDANVRFSLAYRPEETDFIVLNKLDLVHTKRYDESGELVTQKIINNFNFNYTPNTKFEVSLQHGMKYVIDTVEEYEHKGFTQLFGIDTHYDITETWELGMQGSILYAQSADNWDYGFGLYGGYNMFENMMLILGYNWEGFDDTDFSLQTYRIEGPYLQFRMKVDQKSLKDLVRFLSW